MGAWTDVALVKQGMELTFYINGRAAGTEQRALPKTAASLLLGAGGVSHDFCLMDNQTLYLEPGAVVKGRILAYGVKNAAVRGRGIIWQSPGQSIVSLYAENLRVEGITILDPRSMCSHLCESDGVAFTDVRMFSRLGATDGVHIKASRNVAVEDCFIRSNDDCIAVYASFTHYTGNAENIAVLVDFLMAKLHITREDATLLHIEMWAYVHGIAVLCASGQQNWDDALISRMLTDGFEGIKSRFQKNEQ